MIGCIGIGGVILVPALVFLPAFRSDQYSGSDDGLRPVRPRRDLVFARNKSIRWDMAAWLCAGATPTAFVGAWAVSVVNPRFLEAVSAF